MSAPDNSLVSQSEKRSWFTRFLDTVEWLGNLLPHPVTLFAMFALAVVLGSGIAAYFDVSVLDPRPEGAAGRAELAITCINHPVTNAPTGHANK